MGNIVINGGNITAVDGGNGDAIGGDYGALPDYIEINGGNINAVQRQGNGISAKEMLITGGNIFTGSVGCNSTESLIIRGGTLNAKGRGQVGIAISSDGTIEIIGGNILSNGKKYKIGQYSSTNSNYLQANITNGENNLYETQIKLQGVEKDKKVTKLTTSDNINYGIKDMYTLDDGMLYLYLPKTAENETRTISIEVDGKTYSGLVPTTETPEVVTLNEIN